MVTTANKASIVSPGAQAGAARLLQSGPGRWRIAGSAEHAETGRVPQMRMTDWE